MTPHHVTPLGRKIVAAILGTTLFALVLAFLLNIVPMLYTYRQDASDSARSQAELLAASLTAAVDFDDAEAAREVLATLSLIPHITGAAVYVGETSPLATYASPPPLLASKEMVLESSLSSLIVSCPIPSQQADSYLVIAVSLEMQWKLLKRRFLVGAFILVGVFIFCIRMARRFRRKLGDPIHALTDVVREITQGRDYTRRVHHESDDEVGVLVAEFNAMLGKIEQRDEQLSRHQGILEERVEERTAQLQVKQLELLRNNRLLLSEIKKRAEAEMVREEVERINRHDLKSGLSLVIGYPELLLSEGGLKPGQEKHIKRIRAAGYRMLDMIRNQLDIFKMEKGIYALSRSRVDLIEIICGLEEEFGPLLESCHVKLSVQLNGREVVGDESFFISGEGPLIRAMFRNLIQNGIEASSSGDTVMVAFNSAAGMVVSVSNPSPVPTDIRRRFFDKYVTHGKDNGTGLGTYFAALIARTHGADISMKTSEEKGTLITTSFRVSGVSRDDHIRSTLPRGGISPWPDEN